jgi:hypothetical protein
MHLGVWMLAECRKTYDVMALVWHRFFDFTSRRSVPAAKVTGWRRSNGQVQSDVRIYRTLVEQAA